MQPTINPRPNALHSPSTRNPERPARPIRRVGMALAVVLVAGLALGGGLALAHLGNGAIPVPAQGAVAAQGEPLLLAKRRRRKKRKSRKRKSTRVTRPANEEEDFPERESASDQASTPPPAAGGALRRGARVEFDGRLVQGQTAKSGAIYLFARQRSKLRSMVKERSTYRKEILRTVYPKDEYEAKGR